MTHYMIFKVSWDALWALTNVMVMALDSCMCEVGLLRTALHLEAGAIWWYDFFN